MRKLEVLGCLTLLGCASASGPALDAGRGPRPMRDAAIPTDGSSVLDEDAGSIDATVQDGSVAADGGPRSLDGGPALDPTPVGGPLFYAKFTATDAQIQAAIESELVVGGLYQIYWSDIETANDVLDWSEIDDAVRRWSSRGRRVALRIMWSSSGYWPDPAAAHPTPSWVWAAGARYALHAASGTEIPLFWDPVYREHQLDFLDAVAEHFDGNPAILFIDVTPGAETNPYRSGTIDERDPSFAETFVGIPASDGRRYSDTLWWATLQQFLDDADARFASTRLMTTLNRGALAGDGSRLSDVGNYAVARGFMVGQNGLRGTSYTGGTATQWIGWAATTPVFFEMYAETGGTVGTMQEVVDACRRAHCSWLNVYPTDVWRAMASSPDYDAAYEAALRDAATLGAP